MEKTCIVCKKTFSKRPTESLKAWTVRKYCTHSCYWKDLKNNIWNNPVYRDKLSKAHLGKAGYWTGKKRPDIAKLMSRISKGREPWNKGNKVPQITGKKHFAWKGDNVSYGSLHDWVSAHLGRPNKCSHCGREDLCRYEWANISGEYKRNLKDWIRLCKKCHMKMDKVNEKMWKVRRGIIPRNDTVERYNKIRAKYDDQ